MSNLLSNSSTFSISEFSKTLVRKFNNLPLLQKLIPVVILAIGSLLLPGAIESFAAELPLSTQAPLSDLVPQNPVNFPTIQGPVTPPAPAIEASIEFPRIKPDFTFAPGTSIGGDAVPRVKFEF